MLVEFSVSNFKSIRDSQTISMVADNKKDLIKTNTFSCNTKSKMRLLKTAVIYGPNASGKSNIIKAMAFMQQFILTGKKIKTKYNFSKSHNFMFSKGTNIKPTEFEVIFINKNVRYQYGFALLNNRVKSEWLYAYPKNKLQKWFVREYDENSNDTSWYFGPHLSGHKSTWKDSTRSKALFLKTAVMLNSEQLKPIYDWFLNVRTIEHGAVYPKKTTIENCCENEHKKKTTLDILRVADPSIQNFEFKKVHFDDIRLPDGIPQEMREQIIEDLKKKEDLRVEILHTPLNDASLNKDLTSSYVPLEDESDGTKKLFSYIALWMDALTNGKVLFIDELESSLHVQLLVFLINLFQNNEINTANGQLIFTTHETVLLQKKYLRRDQIWFVEKQDDLSSLLYPLTDFHPRKEDALQDRYLQGLYGAIPYTDDVVISVVPK